MPRPTQPPLSGFHMMSQAECPVCINGGFSYIQARRFGAPSDRALCQAACSPAAPISSACSRAQPSLPPRPFRPARSQNANPAGPVAWLLYEAVHRAGAAGGGASANAAAGCTAPAAAVARAGRPQLWRCAAL
jgi:hypothetical protein